MTSTPYWSEALAPAVTLYLNDSVTDSRNAAYSFDAPARFIGMRFE
jgi:hypothetical protein